jgi:hypothetical protein
MQSAITCREGNQLQQIYAFASRSGGYLYAKWWDGPHWACRFFIGGMRVWECCRGAFHFAAREGTEMKRDSNVASLHRVTTFFAAAMLVASGNAALADKAISVSGDSTPSECGAPKKADGGLAMTGSLTGCLAAFIQHTNCRELNGFAFYTELGREEFEGSLHGKPIKFDTQYTFSAAFPSGACPIPDFQKETAGGCIHYISGEKFEGVIRLHDVITPGQGLTNAFYEGFITSD